jgi:hypothetical protein
VALPILAFRMFHTGWSVRSRGRQNRAGCVQQPDANAKKTWQKVYVFIELPLGIPFVRPPLPEVTNQVLWGSPARSDSWQRASW